ncbi:hypothetical protein SAMN05421771_0372 [Granulicella pectinivorans]|uniref:Xaa-Pro dipeptidyl-peptidase C-terminal domain-containing protein n=1 Tax=Granulicella pectinivorans TaxID=474950 RepID=A0A1I6L7C7_9BACT|nr:CocE/NonD family hydrolase [Granulicella pectinivorans]SFR99385.1 hypothetical protein SAMN05421771_0372 [Granulicella pectinivorans]
MILDLGDGITLERAVALRMSDGTILHSDHYYPREAGPHPTLLMRQPYGRDIASTVVYAHPAWFARHGYNVVIQDVRGRGTSEGTFYPFRHEAQDGVDTLALLKKRPESNGKFGMYGFSYQGMTQWLLAARQPEGLLCIAPAQTAHDLYHGWFYYHGALRLASSLGWGLQMLKADARRAQDREASDKLEAAWANLPAQYLTTPYGHHPAIGGYVKDWFENDTPGPYWQAQDISQQVDQITLPALHLAGWFDTYLKGSIDAFQAMQHKPHHHLIAGPWIHIPWGDRIGPHTLGPEANLDTDALHLRWFNHWLKDTGEFTNEPRIRHYALNENQWHEADAIPTPNHTLYLHSEGRANSSKGNGTLTHLAPNTPEPPDLYNYDPEVPVLAPGGATNAPGPTNQAAMELGNNVLIYTTRPLTRSLHVFGSPEVAIHLATSAHTTDLVAKLICVKPNGDAQFLTIGILRRRGLTPDTPSLWSFPLEPTSIVFAPGDRLRLEIASSAYPLYDRNPNTHIHPRQADSWNWARSTQTLFHDQAHTSALHLPILPTPEES